jgi:O-antigen ligase
METITNLRKVYYSYFIVAVICIILTGSRTSFVVFLGFLVIGALVHYSKRKKMILFTVPLILIIIWTAMPNEKRDRIRTLWNPEAGPANAQSSAKGRMRGWEASWEMFKQNPLSGVGAGKNNFIAYRVAHNADGDKGDPFQSHVLFGEVLAEFGLPGAFLFLGLIISTIRSALRAGKSSFGFTRHLSTAIIMAITLLLILGIGGNLLYRPLWLWLAAWADAAYDLIGANDFRKAGALYKVAEVRETA